MSADASVTADLMSVLHDGQEALDKVATVLETGGDDAVAAAVTELSSQRSRQFLELQALSTVFGAAPPESGSALGALHRAWLSVKATLTGDDAAAVLDTAIRDQGHALDAYAKAQEEEISAGLRSVVARQQGEIQQARDALRGLREGMR